jgi:uncharacterized membrane protein
MIVVWTVYPNYGETNLRCAVVGIVLIVVGVILLAWSQKPKYSVTPEMELGGV